jgi:hypothetical protein
MTAPTWAGVYVGIPFRDHGRDREGCDCWGLVRLVIAERTGVALPCYATDYDTETDAVGVGHCVTAARVSGVWDAVEGAPQPFDLAEMFSVLRARNGFAYPPLHVGVVIAPGWLLHTEVVTGALLVRLDERGLGKRIAGYWRHREVADAA